MCLHWFPDPDPTTARMVASVGYWITYAPMARGHWYNAYTPDGLTIASGQLERCLEACERHLACGERLGGRGKRQFRPVPVRLYRHRARPAPALPV